MPRCPSPNHNARPSDAQVNMVVVHNISLPPGEFSLRWVRALFQNHLPPKYHPYFESIAKLRVSAHFVISRRGTVLECVAPHRRAWHAGLSNWAGRENLNDCSIGIELIGDDDTAFTAAQYASLARLIRRIAVHYPLRYIVGHSDIAPQRKTDPGPKFEWERLEKNLPQTLRGAVRLKV